MKPCVARCTAPSLLLLAISSLSNYVFIPDCSLAICKIYSPRKPSLHSNGHTHSLCPILICPHLYLKFPNLLPRSQKCPALIPVCSGALFAPHLLGNPDKVSWRESPSWIIFPWPRKRLGRTVLSSKTDRNVMKAYNHFKVISSQKERGVPFSMERQDEDLNWGKLVTGDCTQPQNNLPKGKAEPPWTVWSFWSTD